MKRLLFPLILTVACVANAEWKIDLNHDALSLYEKGDAAYATLKWSGQEPPAHPPSFFLFDHLGTQIAVLPLNKEAEGWRVEIPTDHLGYFEVRAVGAEADRIIPALGSRPAGRLTLAIVAKINKNPSRNFTRSFMSLQGTTMIQTKDGQAYGWDAYPFLGVQSLGVGYHWGNLEADGPGTLEKSLSNDFQPKWVREANIVPYFQLNGIPMWAADTSRLPEKERTGTSTQRVPPRDWTQWEAYLEKIVPYIAKNYDYLPERVYEVMWEPCIPWGWYGTPEEIVKTFEIAQKVIRKYDPAGKVAGPTLSGLNDTALYETLLKAGLGRYLDVVSFHPYKGYPPEKSAIPEGLSRIQEISKKYAGKSLPFIGTEFGFPEHTTGSALNQGYGLAASLLIFKGEGASKQTLFYLADYAGEPGYGINYNLVSGLPFGPRKISPKPGVPMIRAAIDQIGDADTVGKIDYLGADIWGYVFRNKLDNCLFAALWDASDRNREISFDVGEPQVQVVDAFGNSEIRETTDGKIRLQLGRGSTYIRGISEQIYGSGRMAALLDTSPVWKLYRGQKSSENIVLTRNLSDSEGKISFDTAADINRGRVEIPISLSKGAKGNISFDVAATAPLGPSAGYLRISQGGNHLYRGVQRLEVAPELEISSPTASRALNGGWSVSFKAKNTSPYDWSGVATLQLENEKVRTVPFKLTSGKEKSVAFDVGNRTGTHNIPMAVSFVSDTDIKLNQTGVVTFFAIPKHTSKKSVWAEMKMTELKATQDSVWKTHPGSTFAGDDDLSAMIGYAYDDAGVYVAINVLDDIHRQDASEGTTWSQDSVQLAFDTHPGREQSSNLLAEANESSVSEWTFAWTSRGPEIYLSSAPGSSVIPASSLVNYPGASLEGGRNGNRTLYRITLPWKLLAPRGNGVPRTLGIAAAINDSDRDGEPNDRRALEFFGGILRGKSPSLFGVAQMQKN